MAYRTGNESNVLVLALQEGDIERLELFLHMWSWSEGREKATTLTSFINGGPNFYYMYVN